MKNSRSAGGAVRLAGFRVPLSARLELAHGLFALIVLLDQQYHVTLTVEDFMKLETVVDLAHAAGVNA